MASRPSLDVNPHAQEMLSEQKSITTTGVLSGSLTSLWKMDIEIVDVSIENAGFPWICYFTRG